jgi:dTDP-glucose 4,6-dehydratase
MIFVTGGAGFIGANFVHHWLGASDEPLVNIDALTYAGNLENLADVGSRPEYALRHRFIHLDICDHARVAGLLREHRPRALLHFAAESHVDRSIAGPSDFIRTNINGTFSLLEAVRAWLPTLDAELAARFRFLHVSTDEVYGSLAPDDAPFSETHPYQPNSPYAASKAASDHLGRAYFHTYGTPVLTTHCSNNYGPYQFPEKLIPLMLSNALAGKPLPVYGDGKNVRDWLYVEDHCRAISRVLAGAAPGSTYNIGGLNERTNIELVELLCSILDELAPRAGAPYSSLITYVQDRPGHDRRYAIDATRIERDLDWRPRETIASGLRRTVAWYLDHRDWTGRVLSGAYRDLDWALMAGRS